LNRKSERILSRLGGVSERILKKTGFLTVEDSLQLAAGIFNTWRRMANATRRWKGESTSEERKPDPASFLNLPSALSPRVTHPVVLAADGDDHADPNRTDADGEPTQLANPQAKRQPLGEN
jgi:hypothetical protein